MRLLDAKSYALREFHQSDVPPYAILSHTWQSEEVSLQDLLSGNADLLDGYRKLIGCCEQATSDGFDYVVSSFKILLVPRVEAEQVDVPDRSPAYRVP
jgi:hypothetical protein